MTNLDIPRQRLHNQHLTRPTFATPAEAVHWLGAVQAQDYAAAKWALGLRMQNARDADIDQALADGSILRTHVMRPTWHFVTPADIRWLLALTAPRVKAAMAYAYRQAELDQAIFSRSNAALVKALEGEKQLTRLELAALLKQAGIPRLDVRMGYIMGHAELDGVVCSGGRRGKQFTYALLDERAPQTKKLERDEALAELAGRYFTSHGPATVQDFVWWSGLTTTDAKAGIEMTRPRLAQEVVDGQAYWLSDSGMVAKGRRPVVHFLPVYDEYTVGYIDRSAMLPPQYVKLMNAREGLLGAVILVDGRVVGTWKRTLKKDAVSLAPRLFTLLNKAETRAFDAAIERYSEFLGMPVVLT